MKMKMSFWIVAALVTVAAIGSAFTAYNSSAQQPVSTIVAGHETAIADSQEVVYCDTRSDGITVQGTGVVAIPANIGIVQLGVDVTAETVSAARSQAAEAMTNVIAAVKEEGVEDDDITTTQLNIWPESTWVEEEVDLGDGKTGRRNRQVVTGYRVSNRVRIEIDLSEISDQSATGDASDGEDADVLGAVIDAAAAAGGDDVRVDSISFTADETSENVDEARNMAAANALHRASLYATAFGVEVGTLLSASESVGSTPVFKEFSEARASLALDSASPSTPVSAGAVEITASITAKFAIVQSGCVDKATVMKDQDS